MTTDASVQQSGRDTRSETERVWDPLVRILHWSLIGLFAFAYFTGDEWDRAHEIAGYFIAGIMVVRIAWGLVGSKHARFSDFIYRPRIVLAFLRDTIRMKAKRYIGHNPAGGLMVLVLLLAIITISVSGYMQTMDMFWAVGWVEDVHKISVNATIALIALHVAGVVLASFEHKENLIKSMITGLKRRN